MKTRNSLLNEGESVMVIEYGGQKVSDGPYVIKEDLGCDKVVLELPNDSKFIDNVFLKSQLKSAKNEIIIRRNKLSKHHT